jgi:YHS domain-containing protein
MVGWLLRALLVFLLVRALMKLAGGLLRGLLAVPQAAGAGGAEGRGAGRGPGTPAGPISRGTLVQDPVCGTYVLRERALPGRSTSGAPAFFCSEQCRSAYDAQAARSR